MCPRVVLRFEGLENEFGTNSLKIGLRAVGTKRNSTRGRWQSRFGRFAPSRATKMRGHDGAADIHRSQEGPQVFRTHQGSRGDAEPHRGSEGVLRPVPDG